MTCSQEGCGINDPCKQGKAQFLAVVWCVIIKTTLPSGLLILSEIKYFQENILIFSEIFSQKYSDIVPACRGVVQCPGQQVAEAELHRRAGGEVSVQDEEPDDE